MSTRPFDALLIDFYGTISAGDRDAVESTCERIVQACKLPMTPQDFAVRWGERFFDLLDRSNHDAFRTLYECEVASLQDTLVELGGEGAPASFVVDLENYWVNPPVYADAVEFLRCIDLPVCCVSNADTKPLLRAIERHGFRFDAVVTSESARCYKPAPAIFRRALEALGVSAQRAIHVGDSRHSDVNGAAALGVATVWVKRKNQVYDIGTSQPDYTISSLEDIPGLLHG